MKIGFTTVTFRDKSIEQIFEISNQNNIKLIEWGGDKHLPFDDDIVLNKVIDLSKKYCMCNYSYGSYYRVGDNDFEKFEKICQVVQKIGGKVIRIWLGRKGSLFTSKSQFATMAQEAKQLCEIAQKYNLIVASEFHQKTFNDCGKSSLKMLKEVNMPNFKTYWQPLGNEKKDLSNLKLVIDHVVVAHVFNWKNFDERYDFSFKNERWAKFFEVLKTNANVAFIMEFVKDDSPQQFAKDYKTINKMLEENL